MRRFRTILGLVLALALMLGASAHAAAYYYDTSYDYLIGSMEIVNCTSWTSLREYPDSYSTRLAKIPLGEVVTDCYYYDEKYTYCVYAGVGGYVLNDNLAFIYGPAGYEYLEADYLGNMQIVNCRSYAVLRDYPSTAANQILRIPLGDIVTNVFYHDEKFSYCMYGQYEGYILNSNLEWISGGTSAAAATDWIGDCYIVNCASWASLRELPDSSSYRLARVPYGSLVTDCYYVNERWACCTWNGITGYILVDNLGW